MGTTDDNLKSAFAGKAQTSRMYIAFAEAAEEEGHRQIAKLFRAAAESEAVHAMHHLRTSGGVLTTEENLKMSIERENLEHSKKYTEFIEQSKKDGRSQATLGFNYAKKVEMDHERSFKEAEQSLNRKKDLPLQRLFVCQICGQIHVDDPPKTCPVCGNPSEMFKEIK
ncbi:MAG: rubrerythrin family protein [Methanomassiliicoccales archaeon]